MQKRSLAKTAWGRTRGGKFLKRNGWFYALVSRIGFTQAVADVSIVSGGCYMGGGIKNASGWFGAYYIPCPGDSSKLAKVGEVKVSF